VQVLMPPPDRTSPSVLPWIQLMPLMPRRNLSPCGLLHAFSALPCGCWNGYP